MKKVKMIVTLGVVFLILGGCDEEADQLQPLPLAIEAEAATKAAVEDVLKENPVIILPRVYADSARDRTGYSIEIVKPDPSKNYSMLQVKPDPNTKYSVLIIDPKSLEPPRTIDPNKLDTLLEELKKRNVLVPEKRKQDQ